MKGEINRMPQNEDIERILEGKTINGGLTIIQNIHVMPPQQFNPMAALMNAFQLKMNQQMLDMFSSQQLPDQTTQKERIVQNEANSLNDDIKAIEYTVLPDEEEQDVKNSINGIPIDAIEIKGNLIGVAFVRRTSDWKKLIYDSNIFGSKDTLAIIKLEYFDKGKATTYIKNICYVKNKGLYEAFVSSNIIAEIIETLGVVDIVIEPSYTIDKEILVDNTYNHLSYELSEYFTVFSNKPRSCFICAKQHSDMIIPQRIE
jgi:hypothetical protein